MKLTTYEQEMLDGKYGEGVALAMKIQVGIGEAFDAERMVPIRRAHVALSSQDSDLWFCQTLVDKGAVCKVAPTVNPSLDTDYLNTHLQELDKAGVGMCQATKDAYKAIGAQLTYSCTPYIQGNVPEFGEICAFSESSATPFVNAVYGARSNRESSHSALCAAVTGLVPEYGLLFDENRYGEILVDVQADVKSDFDYQILGWCYPEKYKGLEVPIFKGIKEKPSPAGFMNFGAQLNTSGCVSMYHVLGITPEAHNLEHAVGNKKIKEVITITQKDLDETRERLCNEPSKIEYGMFGCPHLTIEQLRSIAQVCDGKLFKVPVYILTSSVNKELARRMGYLDKVLRAGGHIVSDSCIDIPPCWSTFYEKTGVTDSPKCSYYNEMRKMKFIIRPLEEAIEACIKGEVLR